MQYVYEIRAHVSFVGFLTSSGFMVNRKLMVCLATFGWLYFCLITFQWLNTTIQHSYHEPFSTKLEFPGCFFKRTVITKVKPMVLFN